MLESVLILYISIIVGLILFVIVKVFYKLSAILSVLVDIGQGFDRKIEISYREKEVAAEDALAEEGDEQLSEEASLYLNEDGKFDYRSYAKNKAKREKKKTEPEFIDEFEQAAEETEKVERKNRYV